MVDETSSWIQMSFKQVIRIVFAEVSYCLIIEYSHKKAKPLIATKYFSRLLRSEFCGMFYYSSELLLNHQEMSAL